VTATFNPKRIFILEDVKENPITEKVVSRLPCSEIEYIRNQRPSTIKKMASEFDIMREGNLNAGYARISKGIMVIGKSQPSQFVDKFINKQDCYCPEFYSITPMNNGCYYSCQYCFLQMTYRGIFPYIKLNVNIQDLKRRILRIAQREREENPGKTVVFNGGEKLDSLSFDTLTDYTKFLVPFFSATPQLKNSRLLLVSKSTNIRNLLELAESDPSVTERVILSWSINCDQFASQYENGSPLPSRRLEAAQKCQEAGYAIRLRIDPLMRIKGWRENYNYLIHSIFEEHHLRPDVVTLGSLRFNRGLISLCKARFPDSNLFDYDFVAHGNDKERYRVDDRAELYRAVLGELEQFMGNDSEGKLRVGLCKENPIVWKKVGLRIRGSSCNCIA
jgi:spore photoproduct lyase